MPVSKLSPAKRPLFYSGRTYGYRTGCGEAVMGVGIALEAAKRFPELPYWLGVRIATHRGTAYKGNKLNPFPDIKIFCFPTKWNWYEKSDLNLIAVSASQLVEYTEEAMVMADVTFPIYLVRPGCGNGGLDWKDVKPVLEKYLDNRFVVVEKG